MTPQRVKEVVQVAAELKLDAKCAVMYLASVYKPFIPLVESPPAELRRHMEAASDTIPDVHVQSSLVMDLCAVWEANGARLTEHGRAIAEVAQRHVKARAEPTRVEPTPSTSRSTVLVAVLVTILAFSYAILHAQG